MSMTDSLPGDLRERIARIRLLALDVDGTLTDGQLWLSTDGSETKAFSALDGQGLKLLQGVGIEVALITARNSPVVSRRAKELDIAHIYQGSRDKRGSLRALRQILSLESGQVAFMGDDLPDLPALTWAGLAVAPANAHPWVQAHVHHVTQARGGHGAVREVCDLILDVQGHSDAVLRKYLEQ